jgi:hypothetical protein
MIRSDLEKIASIAIDIDHKMAFGGRSIGNMHLSRVVKIALFLCEKLGADRDVVEVAAYLHDAALPTENDHDYESNKILISEILIKSGIVLNTEFINKVAEAAASHEGTVSPKTLEAKIVHDADVIEKTGLLGVIRHTWKLTNHRKIDPFNISDEDVALIIDHIKWRQSVLQTDIARTIATRNSNVVSFKSLRNVIPVISRLAASGVITEKIAEEIAPLVTENEKASLQGQLSLMMLY